MKTAIYAEMAMVGLILAMVFVVYLLPLTALSLDDHNVLPERGAMSSNADWLWHLVRFDQARLTYVGDFALFRPGLFFMYWVGDVLARHYRMSLNLATVALYAIAACILYLTLRRWCGRLLAFALCSVFFYPNQGYVLANAWHVAGYLVSIVLYIVGFSLLDWGVFVGTAATGNSRSLFVSTTLALFLSTLFHEFTVLAMLATVVFLFIVGGRATSRARFTFHVTLPILIALGGYLLLYGVNWVSYPPPQLWSTHPINTLWTTGSLRSFVNNTVALLIHAGMFLWPTDLAYKPSLNVLINETPLPPGALLRIVLAILALAPIYPALTAVIRSARARAFLVTEVACVAAAIAIIVAVSIGRLATAGTFRDYYYPLVGFFLVVLAGRGLGLYLNRTRNTCPVVARWILVSVLMLAATGRAIEIHKIHQIRYRQIEAELKIVAALAGFFEHAPDRCHAGLEMHYEAEGKRPLWYVPRWIITDRLPSLANMETELQYFDCGIRSGRPVYTVITADHDLMRIDVMLRELALAHGPRAPVAFVRGEFGKELFDQARPDNRFEAAQRQSVDNHLWIIARTREPVRLDGLTISFRYPSQSHILYHFGIRVLPPRGTKADILTRSVAFIDTIVRSSTGSSLVADSSSPGPLPVRGDSWMRWIPTLPAAFSVTFRRDGPDCLVFLKEYLLGQMPDCPGQPVDVEILQWSNGTPNVQLESIISAPAGSRLDWLTIGHRWILH
ncbi:MAG TPA: hypothetical protein VKT83_03955 [bacterium]|nr:hypothetical protein [bacterium]